jgi:hypothetical protein
MSTSFLANQRFPVRFTITSARYPAWIDHVSRFGLGFLYDRDIFVIVAFRVAPTSSAFAESKKRLAFSSSRL